MIGRFGIHGRRIGSLNQAVPPANDLGRLRNWAICTMAEARGDVFFHLDDHLERLRKAAAMSAIPIEKAEGFSGLGKNLKTLVLKCGFKESLARIDVSRGVTEDGFNPAGGANPIVYVQIYQLKRKTNPVQLITEKFLRSLPEIKSPDYLCAEISCIQAHERGFDDVLYVDDASGGKNKEILEATRANIGFFRSDGSFIAPPPGKILEGITMKILLSLVRENRLCRSVKEEPVYYDALLRKEIAGAILTSTGGVVPVSRIDDFLFADNSKINEICSVFHRYREEYFNRRLKI